MKTKKITICLHASNKDTAEYQLQCMSPDFLNFEECHVRLRCDIHPDAYPSYSEMLNTAVNDSKTEVIVLINDKVLPKPGELTRMISLLDAGFGYVGLYSIGFCAITKGLIKKIGWFDERYLGGGYEDDDFMIRLRLNDIGIYDSSESDYNYQASASKQSVTIPLSKSEPHFFSKWKITDDSIERKLNEENYQKYSLEDATTSEWLQWNSSIIGYYYGVGPKRGIPQGAPINHFQGHSRAYRFCRVPFGTTIVGTDKKVIG